MIRLFCRGCRTGFNWAGETNNSLCSMCMKPMITVMNQGQAAEIVRLIKDLGEIKIAKQLAEHFMIHFDIKLVGDWMKQCNLGEK